MGKADEPLTDAVSLAHRSDFQLGGALVRPSIRSVETLAGIATVEPRVMQVLVALADAGGAVLSREDLLRLCWGGRLVGEDAITRAIGEARRLSQAEGSGFHIETIPRIGYRLILDGGVEPVSSRATATGLGTRRRVLVTAASGLTVLALGAYGLTRRDRRAQADALIGQARSVQAHSIGKTPYQTSAQLLRRAVSLAPDRADAWGLLAVALVGAASEVSPARGAELLAEAPEVAATALKLDPSEPNARASQFLLRNGLDDWIVFERGMRAVLADDPDNAFALDNMVFFLQGVGRFRESWDLNERAAASDPLSPTFQFRRALKLWIMGRPAEADRVSARALELWPNVPFVWNARMTVLAFTNRPDAAMKMLADEATRPRLGPGGIAVWRSGLAALGSGAQRDRDHARDVALAAFAEAPGVAANAVMLLSAMGDVDNAYHIAQSFLLGRGPQAHGPSRAPATLYTFASWRGAQWLFTPATEAMRTDARFTEFCDTLGYLGYWRARSIWPDRFLLGSLRAL
ncbi:MAG: winged helix-turn-helix domain-containing protein [Croceibacterium sp.]